MQALGCPSAAQNNSLVRLPGQTQIAALLGALRSERNCGRQVTNLNGARIFCVVQQSDGAAVFPLKIPDAATHESAQHLLKRVAAPRLGPEQ